MPFLAFAGDRQPWRRCRLANGDQIPIGDQILTFVAWEDAPANASGRRSMAPERLPTSRPTPPRLLSPGDNWGGATANW